MVERRWVLGGLLGCLMLGWALFRPSVSSQETAVTTRSSTGCSGSASPVKPVSKPTNKTKANRSVKSKPKRIAPIVNRPPVFTETDTGTPKDGPVEEPDRFVYGLSKEGITDAMRSIAPDVKRCYEKGIRDEDITGGKVMFNFKIEQRIDDPENVDIAQITEVGVKDSTIDSEGVEACVMQLIDELWFDPPDDGAIYIQYPIVFVDPEVE